MPELPEVEHLKRTLEPLLIGATVMKARLHRRDVVHRVPGGPTLLRPTELLVGTQFVALRRHGKNLALIGDNGRVICVHLGMSGSMRLLRPGERLDVTAHVHCDWSLREKHCRKTASRLIFRDPRRFGGLWLFDSINSLCRHRWDSLGPDALSVTARQLIPMLQGTSRNIKSVLLDQSVLAGVGNIYADEALFAAQIHPLSAARYIPRERAARLIACLQRVLRRAIDSGGSTIRDYFDGNGSAGRFAHTLKAYGRAGLPCCNCRRRLSRRVVAQRTSVYCACCQIRYSK